jgi:thiamine-phosphate pyrophosphorylase
MSFHLAKPITYLVTSGETTSSTRPADPDFEAILALVRTAAAAGISIVQLREKNLTAHTLYELAARSTEAVRESATLVLVNDRADVARAAGCHGVHLTTRSLDAAIVRRVFGPEFVIGVSTHTPAEARAARDGGADFATFGPVFDTPSKRAFGSPVGLAALGETAPALAPFPLIALGGVTIERTAAVFEAGAAGVAAIRLFSDGRNLARRVHHIRRLSGL